MRKIRTIFDRENHKVVDCWVEPIASSFKDILGDATATEKLDGMNIRVTIRSGRAVRLEKRCNPDIFQKDEGIVEPWYIDTSNLGGQDKWLIDALKNTDLSELPDGEWSGEAIGKNIQGNPLGLDKNTIIFFSLGQAPVFKDVPLTFEGLKEWLPKQKSRVGTGGIEGIVWHCENGEMFKIKCKDF